MEPQRASGEVNRQTSLTMQRGNFYFGLGFALLGGLVLIVGLGALGITGLGIFSVSTGLAMAAIAITLVAAVSFVTLITLRRTLDILSDQDTILRDQADRHANLSAKVQAQWRVEQVLRDRHRDEALASITASQGVAASASPQGGGVRQTSKPVVALVDPFKGGQVHPVVDIEGIGEHYSKLLVELGLKDTKQLWNADTKYVAGALKIAPAAVEAWQCMAELMAVTGIGKQYAELLVRAQVSSIDELCAETAQQLLARIHKLEKHRGNRIQGNTIGTKVVQSWINAAQAHHGIAPAVGV